jgi:hypothetical protein
VPSEFAAAAATKVTGRPIDPRPSRETPMKSVLSLARPLRVDPLIPPGLSAAVIWNVNTPFSNATMIPV